MTKREIDWIIHSLELVLANGHRLIPVNADDLRALISAARRALEP